MRIGTSIWLKHRLNSGLTKDIVANALGLSRDEYINIEKGVKDMPSKLIDAFLKLTRDKDIENIEIKKEEPIMVNNTSMYDKYEKELDMHGFEISKALGWCKSNWSKRKRKNIPLTNNEIESLNAMLPKAQQVKALKNEHIVSYTEDNKEELPVSDEKIKTPKKVSKKDKKNNEILLDMMKTLNELMEFKVMLEDRDTRIAELELQLARYEKLIDSIQ